MSNRVTIKVARAIGPGEGKKKGKVETDDGKVFWVWPDKLGLLRPGNTYEVDYETSEYNGRTYHTITKCTPQRNTEPQERARTSGGPSPTSEAAFVTHMLAAGVKALVISCDEESLTKAAAMLRSVYRRAFNSGHHA